MRERDPGWFPDPAGTNQQRYWDGARWTDYYLPVGTAASSTVSTVSETSAYSYLQDVTSPTPVPGASPGPGVSSGSAAPAGYHAPSAEAPVPYDHAQPSSGAYPVLGGPPPHDAAATATPTFQAGAYHAPQYSTTSPHPGYGPGGTTIGDDPQRPYEVGNPKNNRIARIAGIGVAVVVVMAVAWGIVMTTRDEPDTPGGHGTTAADPPSVSVTAHVSPGQEVLVEFPADESAVVEADITEAGFYQIEVIDEGYLSDLQVSISTAEGELIADDRGATQYREFNHPADPLAMVWWEPGTYPLHITDHLDEEAQAKVRVTGPAPQLHLDSPIMVTVPAGGVKPYWVEIPEGGSFELRVKDLNGQVSYIGTYDQLGYLNPSSEDPNDSFTTTQVVEFEAGQHRLAVWNQMGYLTEVEVSITAIP